MKKSLVLLASIVSTAILVVILATTTTSFASRSTPCTPIQLIFARGSGQDLDKDEAHKFFEQIGYRLRSNSYTRYELGSAKQAEYQYPAIKIDNLFYTHAVGAWLSSGEGFAYSKSVGEGVNELKTYLTNLHTNCPDSQIVLGGYSQGADVIGDTLPQLPRNIRDQVVFTAYFGDPELNLPEGLGFNPPACRGEQYSTWRRVVEDCDTDNGSLGARHPYTPRDMEQKTGLWCNDSDVICGSTHNPAYTPGHFRYAEDGGAIDQAAREIATKLQTIYAALTIDTRLRTSDLKGADAMIALDYSLEMQSLYTPSGIKSAVLSIAKKAIDAGGRAGLATFCGCNGRFPATLLQPTKDIDEFSNTLSAVTPDNFGSFFGQSTPLKNTLTFLSGSTYWQVGARHMLIPVTNAAYAPSFRFSSFATRQEAPGDQIVHVYPIVPSEIASSFDSLSIARAEVHTIHQPSFDEVAKVIIDQLDAQVEANLTSVDYKTYPGTPLKFDASRSDVYHDTIAKYEWDFTNDGVIDQVTTIPTVTYAYGSEFTGTMAVRVVTQGGLSDTATATIKIANDLSEPTLPAPTGLKLEVTSDSTVRLTWHPISESHDGWVISLNGILLGRVAPGQTFINISDVQHNEDGEFGVQAMMEDGTLGDRATILLKSDGTIVSSNQKQENINKHKDNKKKGSAEEDKEAESTPSVLSAFTDREVKSQERLAHPLSSIPYVTGGALVALGIASAILGGIRYWSKRKRSRE